MKKKFSFHFEPLFNNPFIKKAINFLPLKVLGGSLKMTMVWIAILFCAAFLMKAEAYEGSFQLTNNVITQKEVR